MTFKRWIWAGCAAGFLVLLLLLWIASSAATREAETQARWKEKIQQILVLTKDGKVIPSTFLLKSLEQQNLSFRAKLNTLLDALNRSEEMRVYGNSLEFKGDLFKVQRILLSRAASVSVALPPDIGFKEFTGKAIPASTELEGLSFQLAKVREFFMLMMECGVSEVRELKRGEIFQQRIEADEDVPFYRDFSFQTHFFCSPRAFQRFMARMGGGGSLFIVENLDVKLRAENSLEVQATVKAVSFSGSGGR